MLIVVNPRINPEETLGGWAKHNGRMLLAVAIWMLILLTFAGSQFRSSYWSTIAFAEGTPMYTPYATEEECRAAIVDDLEECVPPR